MSWCELRLGNIGGILVQKSVVVSQSNTKMTYLVSLVCSSGSSLALLSRCELGEVAVVITLPVVRSSAVHFRFSFAFKCSHLVVEDLALAGLGLGDETIIEHVEDILADLLKLGLDLLAVVTDDSNVLV